jgi:hypothetical protein
MVKMEMRLTITAGPDTSFYVNLIKRTLSRALRDKNLLCKDEPCQRNDFSADRYSASAVGYLNKIIAVLTVNNVAAGLSTIRAELESSGGLANAEIGWLDAREVLWRCWYPAGHTEPFERNLDLIAQWAAMTKPTSK